MNTRNRDPRGPYRIAVFTDERLDGNYIKCGCGHTIIHAPHFAAPKPGTEVRCYECGQEGY